MDQGPIIFGILILILCLCVCCSMSMAGTYIYSSSGTDSSGNKKKTDDTTSPPTTPPTTSFTTTPPPNTSLPTTPPPTTPPPTTPPPTTPPPTTPPTTPPPTTPPPTTPTTPPPEVGLWGITSSGQYSYTDSTKLCEKYNSTIASLGHFRQAIKSEDSPFKHTCSWGYVSDAGSIKVVNTNKTTDAGCGAKGLNIQNDDIGSTLRTSVFCYGNKPPETASDIANKGLMFDKNIDANPSYGLWAIGNSEVKKYSHSDSLNLCNKFKSTIASVDQFKQASIKEQDNNKFKDVCGWGYAIDGTTVKSVHSNMSGSQSCGEKGIVVNDKGTEPQTHVFCYGIIPSEENDEIRNQNLITDTTIEESPKIGLWGITRPDGAGNPYTYPVSEALCKKYNSKIASVDQFKKAANTESSPFFHTCSWGYALDGTIKKTINKNKTTDTGCGKPAPGIGVADKNGTEGQTSVYCYGNIPPPGTSDLPNLFFDKNV